MQQNTNTINVDPFVQSELGRLQYENIVLRAQLNDAVEKNQMLSAIAQQYQEKDHTKPKKQQFKPQHKKRNKLEEPKI